MTVHQRDEQFLRQALDLARQGIGLASPNPHVGSLIADHGGSVIGSGFHTYDGLKHAEVLALDQAGSKARGSTLYVNLEPCSHQGRTPPCADAIIAAGIRRVVACMPDPNPKVSGQGFARLRSAGIEVAFGILEEEAKALNESFAKYIRTRTPLITLKTAMTLDGKIAPPPAPGKTTSANWITGDPSRAHVQQLRHHSDAILAGVGTVLADDPLLTDRSGLPRRRPLLRVILDSRLRLPIDSRLAQSAHEDVLVLCSFAEEKKKRQLQKHGIRVEQIGPPTPEGHPDPQAMVRFLGEMEITSVLVEGGAKVNWAVLASGIVDKVFLYYAPKILAGANSTPFVAGPGFGRMADAPHLRDIRLHRFGEDFAVEGYLRDPYAG